MTRLAPTPRPGGGRPWPRAEPIERLPILILFPHSRCNCRCAMCDIWRSERRDELSVEEVATWIDEGRALGLERIVLSGGEPLMHSRLGDLARLLADSGLGVTLLSTGLLLKRHAETVASFADDVVVSLDGPPEIHDQIRDVPRAFARLAEGVGALRSVAPRLALSARTTVQRANYRSLPETVATARRLDLDRISFLAVDSTSEAFDRPGGWGEERAAEVALGAADLPALATELDRLERDCRGDFLDQFIAESAAKLRRRLGDHFAALAAGAEPPPVVCNAPWVSSVVEADGTVRPCFFQPPLGNVRVAGGLGAVLNSPPALNWRRGLDPGRDAICRRCVCSLNLVENGGAPAVLP